MMTPHKILALVLLRNLRQISLKATVTNANRFLGVASKALAPLRSFSSKAIADVFAYYNAADSTQATTKGTGLQLPWTSLDQGE